MSGGFFRGTSTDQDTRFSNKKAKLLKSQKFSSELETLVDMTKVKMDIMKPWIAKRVTELIGFEDEVLINFIYGLLEGKEVNGKEVQISLTGFMERNTGKFMKELWLLLLSAQQNLSGVPQQFLDAKEEETKKKKAETDRIALEIQKKKEKEKQELQQETSKLDGDSETLGDKPAELELNLKPDSMVSNFQPADERKQNDRKSTRGRSRDSKSPNFAYHSASPRQRHSTPPSRSFSNSRSYSNDRRSSRSVSRSPPRRSRSISSERRYPTSPRRSVTPRKRRVVQPSPSPPRRRSFYSKRRSVSPSRRRSPSPARYRVRSPWRYRSRSPLNRRSRSPRRRSRTPVRTSFPRRRSRTPVRSSPAHRRSPSPLRRRSRSPIRRRSPSPALRTSPARRRSPSPLRRRSRSPVRRRSPSPARRRPTSPGQRRLPSPLSDKSPSHGRRRSPSPLHRRPRSPLHRGPPSIRRESGSPARRRNQQSPSTPRQQSISPVQRRSSMISRKRSLSPTPRRSPRESSSPLSVRDNSSPVRRESLKSTRSPPHSHGERFRERAELSAMDSRGPKPVEFRPVNSLRSPQRDTLDRNDFPEKELDLSFSKRRAPFESDASRERAHREELRSSSPDGTPHRRRERAIHPESPSPMVKAAGPKPHRDSFGASAQDKNNSTARESRERKNEASGKNPPSSDQRKDLIRPTKLPVDVSKSVKSQLTKSEKTPDRVNRGEHREKQESSDFRKATTKNEKRSESFVNVSDQAGNRKIGEADDNKRGYRSQELEVLPKSRKSDLNDLNGSVDSLSKESDEQIKVKEKRKHKKSDRHDMESDDYSSYDSHEERKEAKRRRKEEKRLKREERRRRRDERHRRREEKRAEKLKLKSVDTGNPSSDLERDSSEDENDKKRVSQTRGNDEAKSEQKNLEIELREKALESLRAKRRIGNSKN